jgi:hypothetical protein
MSDNDFEQAVLEAAAQAGEFCPLAVYDPDGDCIEFLISNESYRAERFDCLVTIYYGRESGKIVGSLIKGVKTFIRDVLKKSPGFKIEIHDSKLKLVHLFTARMWACADDPGGTEVRIYKTLRDAAELWGTEAAIDDLALV